MADITYRRRGEFRNDEVNEQHAAACEHQLTDDDRHNLAKRHSLDSATAPVGANLAGLQ